MPARPQGRSLPSAEAVGLGPVLERNTGGGDSHDQGGRRIGPPPPSDCVRSDPSMIEVESARARKVRLTVLHRSADLGARGTPDGRRLNTSGCRCARSGSGHILLSLRAGRVRRPIDESPAALNVGHPVPGGDTRAQQVELLMLEDRRGVESRPKSASSECYRASSRRSRPRGSANRRSAPGEPG